MITKHHWFGKLFVAVMCYIASPHLLHGDPPYPQSPVIAGIHLDWSTHQRGAQGSDNFGLAWAADDNLYGTWGDGSGFNGSDISMGVARIEGTGDAWTGTDVWYGGPRNSIDPATQPFSGKSWATIAVNDVLYMWFVPDVPDTISKRQRDHYAYADLAKSTDLGQSWTKTGVRFFSTEDLTIPAFINFGKNNAGARDEYVYSYFSRPQPTGMMQKDYDLIVHQPGDIYLTRAKASEMESGREAYEWFRGLDSAGNPLWGDVTDKSPVFHDPNGVGWTISSHYNAGLGRYILSTEHTESSSGNQGIFDAPEPWGPWTTVKYWTPEDHFGESRPGDSLPWENNVFFLDFPTKWISEDGKNFTMNFTGAGRSQNNDSFNTVAGHFELANADFDQDNDVDGADFLRWQRHYAANVAGQSLADANQDGQVDSMDLVTWKNQYGNGNLPTALLVPEPNSMALVLSGLFLVVDFLRSLP